MVLIAFVRHCLIAPDGRADTLDGVLAVVDPVGDSMGLLPAVHRQLPDLRQVLPGQRVCVFAKAGLQGAVRVRAVSRALDAIGHLVFGSRPFTGPRLVYGDAQQIGCLSRANLFIRFCVDAVVHGVLRGGALGLIGPHGLECLRHPLKQSNRDQDVLVHPKELSAGRQLAAQYQGVFAVFPLIVTISATLSESSYSQFLPIALP